MSHDEKEVIFLANIMFDAWAKHYGHPWPWSNTDSGTCDRFLEQAACVLNAGYRLAQWRDISTAPKDGTLIIVTTGDSTGFARWGVVARRDTLNDIDDVSGPCAVFVDEYGWRNPNNKEIKGEKITHWMPRPPELLK